MAGKALRLLCVGKLKTVFWKEAANHYLERIGRMRPISVTEIRDADAALAPRARADEESARLCAALESGDYPIALDEGGKTFTSGGFAEMLAAIDQKALGRPGFIIGGPYGLAALGGGIRKAARITVSLSGLTWPHELARVLLLEQIYRAECIRRKIPYHHH